MDSPTLPVAGSLREEIENLERYRTFWERFWAGVLDGLVLLPISIMNHFISKPGRPAAVLISWATFFFFSVLAYSILMHARFGQTVGKMLMGVKVWDVSEGRLPSLRQAFLRDIGNVVPNVAALAYFIFLVASQRYVGHGEEVNSLPGAVIGWTSFAWFLVEVITMFTNQKRRALHDFIAGTVVCLD